MSTDTYPTLIGRMDELLTEDLFIDELGQVISRGMLIRNGEDLPAGHWTYDPKRTVRRMTSLHFSLNHAATDSVDGALAFTGAARLLAEGYAALVDIGGPGNPLAMTLHAAALFAYAGDRCEALEMLERDSSRHLDGYTPANIPGLLQAYLRRDVTDLERAEREMNALCLTIGASLQDGPGTDEYPDPTYCVSLALMSGGLLALSVGNPEDGINKLQGAHDIFAAARLVLESNVSRDIYALACVDAVRAAT